MEFRKGLIQILRQSHRLARVMNGPDAPSDQRELPNWEYIIFVSVKKAVQAVMAIGAFIKVILLVIYDWLDLSWVWLAIWWWVVNVWVKAGFPIVHFQPTQIWTFPCHFGLLSYICNSPHITEVNFSHYYS